MKVAICILSIVFAFVAVRAASAEDLLFGPEQFGNTNLEFKQSTSGEQLEAILGDRAKFEPLITYNARSKLRHLSEPIGRLDVLHGRRGMETCTASIISSQYILTNYHCIPGTGEYGPVTAAELVMGYYDVADDRTVKRYSVDIKPVEADRALDYAILSVSGNPANDFGVIRILNEDPEAGASLIMFHHPAGRPKHVTRSGCRVAPNYRATDDRIYHSCDTLPGSSGAPVFAEFGRGVLGLHYAGPGSLGPGQYNFAKRMRRILADSRVLGDTDAARVGAEDAGESPAFAGPPAIAESTAPPRRVGEKFRDCADCPEMVVAPAGSFRMGDLDGSGDADEKPVHTVTISKPFAVGVYEVTFAEWDSCVAAGGCGGYRPSDQGWGRGRRPAINVSWEDAQAYVAWLSRKTGENYRLLSEAEWEYVALAGSTSKFHFGDSQSALCRYANGADLSTDYDWRNTSCSDGYGKQAAPVGSFRPNAFGLYDVHGNVLEWVQDCWNDSYAGAPTNGQAWEASDCVRRVLRGGSWVNRPERLRSANRNWYNPEFRSGGSGFRVSRTLD